MKGEGNRNPFEPKRSNELRRTAAIGLVTHKVPREIIRSFQRENRGRDLSTLSYGLVSGTSSSAFVSLRRNFEYFDARITVERDDEAKKAKIYRPVVSVLQSTVVRYAAERTFLICHCVARALHVSRELPSLSTFYLRLLHWLFSLSLSLSYFLAYFCREAKKQKREIDGCHDFVLRSWITFDGLEEVENFFLLFNTFF